MIIAMGIAIIVMAGCMLMLTYKVVSVDQKVEREPEEKLAASAHKRLNNTITTYNTRFSSVDAKQADADAQIADILKRIQSVADRMGELEEKQTTDHNNLTDIRMRYINYRQPVNTGSGVPWAAEYRCNEEGEDNA